MAETTTFRTDPDVDRAIRALTADGTQVSAKRTALAVKISPRCGEQVDHLTIEGLRRVEQALRLVLSL